MLGEMRKFFWMLAGLAASLAAGCSNDDGNDGPTVCPDPEPLSQLTADVSLYVDKEFLCRGIGGELLAALERDARRAGIENLVSLITSENENSLRFHERHGFSCAGELKNVGLKFGQRQSVKYYRKSLR